MPLGVYITQANHPIIHLDGLSNMDTYRGGEFEANDCLGWLIFALQMLRFEAFGNNSND